MGRGWWGILGVCALLTWQQIPRFASDVALWQAAARVSPSAPRPAVNLAAQYVLRGDDLVAQLWMARARELVAHPSRAHERDVVLRLLERQQLWIDAFSPSR